MRPRGRKSRRSAWGQGRGDRNVTWPFTFAPGRSEYVIESSCSTKKRRFQFLKRWPRLKSTPGGGRGSNQGLAVRAVSGEPAVDTQSPGPHAAPRDGNRTGRGRGRRAGGREKGEGGGPCMCGAALILRVLTSPGLRTVMLSSAVRAQTGCGHITIAPHVFLCRRVASHAHAPGVDNTRAPAVSHWKTSWKCDVIRIFARSMLREPCSRHPTLPLLALLALAATVRALDEVAGPGAGPAGEPQASILGSELAPTDSGSPSQQPPVQTFIQQHTYGCMMCSCARCAVCPQG